MRALTTVFVLQFMLGLLQAADPAVENPSHELPLGLRLSKQLGALFTFSTGLKPSDADPEHRSILSNHDRSLVGCTIRPATETGSVYLFLTRTNGDFLVMQDINHRLTQLFRKLPEGFTEDCIVLEGITGRTLVLSSRSYSKLPNVDFRVRVADDGTLSLIKP